ncbi:DUF11 domain-containing protein [Kangiella sp. TOML190]|uniref:DUF11 domain-containing protein n=1 Tax=Kangiella sp. TOML190 TaxID=2931351 RepID=UPI00203D0909|nr:DUF11 domain-containing protein [Kangiella sp. TOML190]
MCKTLTLVIRYTTQHLTYTLNNTTTSNGQHVAEKIRPGVNNPDIETDASGSGKFLFNNTDGGNSVGEAWGSPGAAPITVTPNTLYRLSFKMSNFNGFRPQLITAQINGTTLATGITNSAPYLDINDLLTEWETFNVNWLSGSATTTADISLIQTRTNGGGIDWGFDEIWLCPIRPDIEVTKDDTAANYTPGGTGSYTIQISNTDATPPDQGVESVQINDSLPAGLTLSGAWSCSVTTAGAGAVTTACGTSSGGAVGGSAVNLSVDLAEGGVITITVPIQYSNDPAQY